MKVSQIIEERIDEGKPLLHSIAADVNLTEAAERLCVEHVGALLVEDAEHGGKYIGVLSERDIMQRCRDGEDLTAESVYDAMTSNMVVAHMSDDIDYVLGVMNNMHIRHIPILEETDAGTRVVALLSMRHIMRAEIEERDRKIHYMNDFLGGTFANR
jgi:CBS domain-containing protein